MTSVVGAVAPAGEAVPAAIKQRSMSRRIGSLLAWSGDEVELDASGSAYVSFLQSVTDALASRLPCGHRLAPECLQCRELADQRGLLDRLEGSYLVVQGPPGSGKTYRGARLITHLLAQGRKVGITAQSHKVIHNWPRGARSLAS